MINILKADTQINHYLIKTAQNYNIKNREIAQATNITESLISNYMKNARTPSRKNREKLWNYLYSVWQAGIIKLPASNNWTTVYYLPVMDIKNPFETWRDSEYHGSEPEDFEKWIVDWEQKGTYKVIELYTSYDDFKREWYKDGMRYNIIYERVKENSIDTYAIQDFIEDYEIIQRMKDGLL